MATLFFMFGSGFCVHLLQTLVKHVPFIPLSFIDMRTELFGPLAHFKHE